MLVDEPRCFWQLIFSETEDNAKFFLCRGETLSLCVFLRHSRGSSDFRKTQCRWGTLIHYFLSEDGRCDASSARLCLMFSWSSSSGVACLEACNPSTCSADDHCEPVHDRPRDWALDPILPQGWCSWPGSCFLQTRKLRWFPVRYLPLVWPLQGPVFALWAVFYPLCCQLWTYNKILCWIHAGIGKYTWNVYIVKLAVIILQLMNTFMSQ